MLWSAFSLISCNSMSAMIGDSEKPIGVPKVCLYMTLLKVKYVDVKTNFTGEIKSSIGMLVFLLIDVHLFTVLLIARSSGMLVKSEITSNDIKISVSWIGLPERELYNSRLFLTCLWLGGKLIWMILCKKEASGYSAVFINNTIILNG